MRASIAVVVAAWLVAFIPGAASSQDANCTDIGNKAAAACWIRAISSISVEFQGNAAKEYKKDFEDIIALRLRNDLSVLNHDLIRWEDAYQYAVDKLKNDPLVVLDTKYMREKSYVLCNIWTVGDSFPIASHVTCKLGSYGSFDLDLKPHHESAVLGYSSKEKLKHNITESIEIIIRDIGVEFFKTRGQFSIK